MRTLTEAQSGQRIELRSGDSFAIRLPENPTTGFRWAIDALDRQYLAERASDYRPAPAPANAVGTGGERSFEFAAVQPGETRLALKLWREFEGEASVTKRFELRISIAR